jgi:hypothetical protein|tara:strand:+ start:760 stop:2334 length:1575 start_codon:yes stop_codon:yes gene_type:complete
MDKFPSIDNVHEVLSDLNGLFEDRNALLNAMFKEDKYKEFLLAENIQSLVEADKRDDSAGGKIKRDLADGYEVLKAQTTMRKFANFISPGSLQTLDLSDSSDFEEPEVDEEEEEIVEEKEEKQEPEKGEKGDKGDPGETTLKVDAPKTTSPFPFIADGGATSQKARMALKEGGAVTPSPMQNFLNKGAQRPETKSGVKSLESLGLVGKKNVASELTKDLGLDEYKKALADAMALPLKAVAAGLAGLLDNLDVPGGEGAAVEGQVAKVGKTFGVKTKKKKKKKESGFGNFVQGGGIVGALGRMFGGGKKKKKKQQTEEGFMAEADAYEAEVQRMVDPYGSDETMEDYAPQGGPSLVRSAPGYLGIGGASHPKLAPDTLSTRGDTKIDAMKNSIRNITQGAKNMFMNSKAVTQVKAATGFVSKLLGGIQPASKGSQYNNQNINELTEKVTLVNESRMAQKTKFPMGYNPSEPDTTEAMLREMAAIRINGMGIDESDSLPPAPLKVSKYLVASITSTHGGETPQDIL